MPLLAALLVLAAPRTTALVAPPRRPLVDAALELRSLAALRPTRAPPASQRRRAGAAEAQENARRRARAAAAPTRDTAARATDPTRDKPRRASRRCISAPPPRVRRRDRARKRDSSARARPGRPRADAGGDIAALAESRDANLSRRSLRRISSRRLASAQPVGIVRRTPEELR